MQLFILFALLIYASKSGGLQNVKPLVDGVGDEHLTKAYEQARQITAAAGELETVLSAVRGAQEGGAEQALNSLFKAFGGTEGEASPPFCDQAEKECGEEEQGFAAFSSAPPCGEEGETVAFPLAPIVAFADGGILSALSRYIAAGD